MIKYPAFGSKFVICCKNSGSPLTHETGVSLINEYIFSTLFMPDNETIGIEDPPKYWIRNFLDSIFIKNQSFYRVQR